MQASVSGCGAMAHFRFRSLQSTITDWDDYATSLLMPPATGRQVTIWFRDLTRRDGEW